VKPSCPPAKVVSMKQVSCEKARTIGRSRLAECSPCPWLATYDVHPLRSPLHELRAYHRDLFDPEAKLTSEFMPRKGRIQSRVACDLVLVGLPSHQYHGLLHDRTFDQCGVRFPRLFNKERQLEVRSRTGKVDHPFKARRTVCGSDNTQFGLGNGSVKVQWTHMTIETHVRPM
jgi:hypothetical protein